VTALLVVSRRTAAAPTAAEPKPPDVTKSRQQIRQATPREIGQIPRATKPHFTRCPAVDLQHEHPRPTPTIDAQGYVPLDPLARRDLVISHVSI
jgi:hypothetical protein